MNIFEEVKKRLAKKTSVKKIEMDTVLKDLGIDSLDIMDILIKAEEQFSIQIPDDKLMDIKSVKDIVEAFEVELNNGNN
ncbi:phosphopantetheine-binding protein [Spiroplasma endosymbiont of Anurida maritima]|uniref:acyl carrier protein n=1 Tax=Spiroplasma endosymbiont of Anurida maritima TaxID=2967972 RepID=UPI0036D41A40